jgi:amino acid adenylation domain-containing protein
MSIYSDVNIEISHINFSNQIFPEKEVSINTVIKEEVDSLFDLVNGPLFRVSLIKIEDLEYLLTLTFHHIIGDGLSFDIILEELGTLYSAFIENATPILPNPERFSEFAEKTNSFIESREYKPVEDFWLNIYKESVPTIDLKLDFVRPEVRTYNCHRMDFPLDDKIINALKNIGVSNGCSLVTTLLAAFEVFLYKLTNQNDLVVGFPSSGNILYDMRQLVGDCVNLLPLRSKVDPNLSFLNYLKQRNSQLFDAYEHQQVTFGHLLKSFAIARDPSRIPLIPVVFTVDLNRDIENEFSFSGLSHEFKINPRQYATFEIQLHAFRTKNGPSFQWTYNTTLFNQETINQMMITFEKILQKVVEDPSKSISQITFQDFKKDYNEISGISTSYPKSTLHEIFAKRVEIFPCSIALEFNDKKITYRELGKMINQMANYLWFQGLRPGQTVAISLDRSPELIASLFAVLQCGACYIPIDISYPEARLNLMIEDSDATFYIGLDTKRNLPNKVISLSVGEILNAILDFPSEPVNLKVSTKSAAYIIYTSGSTGKPKGVKVAHRNVINLIYSMAKEPGISAKDKIFALTTIAFDAMVMEIYLPLLFGACVVLVDDETRSDGQLLLKKAIKDKITVMWGTPSMWQILLNSGWEIPLNMKALIGGEPVPLHLAHELLSRCSELWNIYGPTETTVCCALTQISVNDNPITIGKPIANTQIYILDPKGIPVNQGEVGEIVIAGDGVSLGYVNRSELTNERFINNPFQSGRKMYLSGDLGKISPNGQLQCLGRIDQQVKVRGYRIELGEIEHVLMSIDGIKSAVVLAETDILIAFIIADFEYSNELDLIRLWRNELASQLPTFMVPDVFHVLDKMPTTINDKIDRKTLLQYKSNFKSKEEYTAPRTEEEKIVATIWKKNLNIENIDIFSNFFEIGGHSIKAVSIMTDIQKQTGKRFPLSSLFQYSTVEKFAKLLKTESEILSNFLVPLKPSGNKTPLFIIHGAGLNILNFAHVINHFDENQPVYGFQGIGPNGYDNWFESIEDMAACYIESIIKINPKGPYAVAGFSFGGIVAFEIARQLREQGKTVSIIALLDTYVDSSYYYASPLQKRVVRYYDHTYRRLDYLTGMLTSWKSLKLRVSSKKEYLQKKYFGLKDNMTEEEGIALKEFIEADSMVKKIVDRYHLKPQNCNVDLFRSKDDDNYKLDSTHLGWKKAALKGITIHNISGNHLGIVAPPNDKVLAKMIQNLLNEKHAYI